MQKCLEHQKKKFLIFTVLILWRSNEKKKIIESEAKWSHTRQLMNFNWLINEIGNNNNLTRTPNNLLYCFFGLCLTLFLAVQGIKTYMYDFEIIVFIFQLFL